MSGTPVTLAEMIVALRERCQLDVNDPLGYDDVLTEYLSEAVARFAVSNPHGWPWDTLEMFTATAPGDDTIVANVSGGMTKIRFIIIFGSGSATWQFPLERLTRLEQLERWPNDTDVGIPRSFSIMGADVPAMLNTLMTVRFRPVPADSYTVLIGGYRPLVALTNPAAPDPAVNDYQIGDWSGIVLEYAAHLVYRSKGDLAEAIIAAKTFDDDVLAMRRTVRRVVGPGIGMRPLIDEATVI